MPEPKNIVFNYKEVAEALISQTDVDKGYWGLYVKFGISAANISTTQGGALSPAAIVPILELGIQRFDKQNNLTVDASKINLKKKVQAKK